MSNSHPGIMNKQEKNPFIWRSNNNNNNIIVIKIIIINVIKKHTQKNTFKQARGRAWKLGADKKRKREQTK